MPRKKINSSGVGRFDASETEQIIEAIRSGMVDAFVVEADGGEAVRIFEGSGHRHPDAEQVLSAIGAGEVDAFVVQSEDGDRVLTLHGPDESYQVLLDQIKEGTITLNLEGRILYAGSRFMSMVQLEEQPTAQPFAEFLGENQSGRFFDFIALAARAQAVEEFDLVPASGGEPFPVVLRARAFKLNSVDRAIGLTITDLTDQRLLEKLHLSEQRYRSAEAELNLALEAAEIGIWRIDLLKGCAHRDARLNRIFGLEAVQTVVPRGDFFQFVHEDDKPEMVRKYQEATASGGDFLVESRIKRPDGALRWIRTRGRFEMDEEGLPTQGIGTVIDITDIKESAEKLKGINQQLEQRVEETTRTIRARSLELRKLAHEQTKAVHRERRRIADMLHNDLQQILVAASIRLNPVARETTGKNGASLARVNEFIQQAIGCTRSLTAEVYPPILQQGTLADTFGWLAREMKEKHDLDVRLDIAPETQTCPDEIHYILFESARELLFNSVKHSGVKTAAVRVAFPDDAMLLAVSDEGRGSNFSFDDLHAQSVLGEHLGLLGVKERIENYGGIFQVKTGVGHGFCAEIMMPHVQEKAKSPDEEIGKVPDKPKRGKTAVAVGDTIRVVAVDDHKLVREGIVNILHNEANLTVVGEASDGVEALEIIARLEPDLVLMDVNLPRMNGIATTQALRRRQPHIRVIALSVNQDAAAIQVILDAGASGYVDKVDCADDLIAMVNRVMKENPGQATPPPDDHER